MNKKQEEFLTRLRETFRVEADEHIEAITAGLVSLESCGEKERAPLIERIFREAHSLKGAARSVSLAAAESLCQELESVFAAMKRHEISISKAVLDDIHPALDSLAGLCASPGSAPTPEAQEKEQHALAMLKRLIAGQRDNKPEPPAIMAGSRMSAETVSERVTHTEPAQSDMTSPATHPAPTKPERSEQEPAQPTPLTAVQETVRVSTAKLAAILLETEELVSARIAMSGHAAELRKIADDLGRRNHRLGQEMTRNRASKEGIAAASEIIESNLLCSKTLENTLRNLAILMKPDVHTLGVIVDNLLDDVKKVLLLPCSHLLNAFPKLVRDLAREHEKEADLVIHGEDIEIDRRILDEIKDPLIHLLRNCIDHGIEKPAERERLGKPARGIITITATPIQGNRAEIMVSDDGAGIDVGRVRKAAILLGLVTTDEAASMTEDEMKRILFYSGLTTSPIITDLSGRGLGLAIVREKVEKLGGSITVESAPGSGTTFRMLVPLSLAAFRGVFVEVAGRQYAIPTSSVVRVVRVKEDHIKTVENRQTITVDDCAVSLVRLRDILELSGPEGHSKSASCPVVVIRAADRQVAFLVDEVVGEHELMVKSLGTQIQRVRNIAGASISNVGAIVPILNALDLVASASTGGRPGSIDDTREPIEERRGRLLIAEDSITARTLVKSILEGAGYEVVATVDGMDALTRLKTEPFDLVVSDVDMPRMNGFELTSKIRSDKKLETLPVVLVTALGTQKDREYGIEVGANAYIIKSDFDQSNLLEIVQRLL